MNAIKIPNPAEGIRDIFHKLEKNISYHGATVGEAGKKLQQSLPHGSESPQKAWQTNDPQALRELYGLADVPEDIDAQHMIVFLMMTRAKQIQGHISTIAQDQGNLQIETEEMATKLKAVQEARFGDKDEDSRAAVISELQAQPFWGDIKNQVQGTDVSDDKYAKELLTQIAEKKVSWWSQSHSIKFGKTGLRDFYSKYKEHPLNGGHIVVSRELIERAESYGIDILAKTHNDAGKDKSELGAFSKDYVLVDAWDLGAIIRPIVQEGGDLSSTKQKAEVQLDPQTRQWLIDHGLPPPEARASEKEWDSYQSSVQARITNNQNQMQVATRELTKLTHYMTQYMQQASQMQASAHRSVAAWVNALKM